MLEYRKLLENYLSWKVCFPGSRRVCAIIENIWKKRLFETYFLEHRIAFIKSTKRTREIVFPVFRYIGENILTEIRRNIWFMNHKIGLRIWKMIEFVSYGPRNACTFSNHTRISIIYCSYVVWFKIFFDYQKPLWTYKTSIRHIISALVSMITWNSHLFTRMPTF